MAESAPREEAAYQASLRVLRMHEWLTRHALRNVAVTGAAFAGWAAVQTFLYGWHDAPWWTLLIAAPLAWAWLMAMVTWRGRPR